MSTADDETKTGAEGQGSAGSAAPFAPSKDDDTPLGDSDQHSKVPSHGKTPEQEGVKQDPNSTD